MRTTITILIILITLNTYGQEEKSKWSLNFNYQNDSYLPRTGTEPSRAFGVSSFRGWALSVDRTILQKKYIRLDAGIGLNRKNLIITDTRLNSPFKESVSRGKSQYYVMAPFTIKYTKSKKIQPFLSVTPAFEIFRSKKMNNVSHFHPSPGQNFLQIMPGAEFRISEQVKVFVGATFTNYNFFGQGRGKWSAGFQIGVKINPPHRKRKKN